MNTEIKSAEETLRSNSFINEMGEHLIFYTAALKLFQEYEAQFNPTKSTFIIEKLKSECKRVKIERNNYEQELIYARRRVSKLKAQIEALQPINSMEQEEFKKLSKKCQDTTREKDGACKYPLGTCELCINNF